MAKKKLILVTSPPACGKTFVTIFPDDKKDGIILE